MAHLDLVSSAARRRLGQDPPSARVRFSFQGARDRTLRTPQLSPETAEARAASWPALRISGSLAGPVAQVVRAHA